MLKQTKGFIAGFLVAILLFGGTAFAATRQEDITVHFRDIRLYVNNTRFIPRDANNNVLEPFIYDGSTYLPVRAVGEALGRVVSWDGATNSIYIGDVVHGGLHFPRAVPPISTSDNERVRVEDDIRMGGTVHHNAITYSTSFNSTEFSQHTLDGRYRSITGSFGRVDGSPLQGASVSIFGDGNLLESFTIGAQQTAPRSVTVDLTGVF